jgi:hypothetical protein
MSYGKEWRKWSEHNIDLTENNKKDELRLISKQDMHFIEQSKKDKLN